MADKQETASSGSPDQPEVTQIATELKKVEISVEPAKENLPASEIGGQKRDDLSQLMPTILQALCFDSSKVAVQELHSHNTLLQSLLGKVIELLKDKSGLCVNLEKQNNALLLQCNSLKDVVAITKDLLSIRNMEVEHLHVDMKSLEEKINIERERHNNMLNRMSEAVKLNESLKTEYQSQLGLFNELRARYEEKVQLLESENKRLSACVVSTTNTTDTQTVEDTGEHEGSVQLSLQPISPP